MTDSSPPKRPRGRPPKPGGAMDDAERAAAYRDRKAGSDARGAVAWTLFQRPTLKLIEVLVARLLRAAADRGALVVEVRAAVDRGIAAGYQPPAVFAKGRQADIEDAIRQAGESPTVAKVHT